MQSKLNKLYLHIGCEKTGTTSVQRTFAENRDYLSKKNILYPICFGATNHQLLPALFLKSEKASPIRMAKNLESRVAQETRKKELVKEFWNEIKSTNAKIAVLSSEQLSSNLKSKEEIRSMIEWLLQFSEKISVIVYLRRQDDMFISSYSTEIKSGGVHICDPSKLKESNYKYNYFAMLELWNSQNVEINANFFKKDLLLNQDIVQDFKKQIGIKNLDFSSKPKNSNPSLDKKTFTFLRLVNKYLPPIGEKGWLRGNLQEILSGISLDEKIMLSHEQSIEIMSLFTESNKMVFEKYLKNKYKVNPFERNEINKGKFNNSGLTADISIEEMSYIFAEVWKKKQIQTVKLKKKINLK